MNIFLQFASWRLQLPFNHGVVKHSREGVKRSHGAVKRSRDAVKRLRANAKSSLVYLGWF